MCITKDKYKAFKEGFSQLVKQSKDKNTRAFIKSVNHRIDGFGNHYKYGNVSGQYRELDAWVRAQVRLWLCGSEKSPAYSNERLRQMGLHSLSNCYLSVHQSKKKVKQPRPAAESSYYTAKPAALDYGAINKIAENSEKIVAQLSQCNASLRRLCSLLAFEQQPF